MARYGMVIDLDRCVGCQACTIACKAENGTPRDVFFCKVLTEEVGEFPKTKNLFLPVLCNHCDNPPCVPVCPTGATYVRNDGIVLMDNRKCVGCSACVVACPYTQRFLIADDMLTGYYDELTPYEKQMYTSFEPGTVAKCTLCSHRVDEGRRPACVETCPTAARIFGDYDDPGSEVSKLLQVRSSFELLPEHNTKPRVRYLKK